MLFTKYYSGNISKTEMKVLRNDILENLLNNNPLAIKIITTNIPKGKSMEALKLELENDFFNTTKIELSDIFNRITDENIERSSSLYNSMFYSYLKLTNLEKLTFEILSLFPDGIHLHNFKQCFQRDNFKFNKNKITDQQIKFLENKSLIENHDGIIKLQSIVRRFAEFQFSNREENEKISYYESAFVYNQFTLDFLSDFLDQQLVNTNIISLEIFDHNTENFILKFYQ